MNKIFLRGTAIAAFLFMLASPTISFAKTSSDTNISGTVSTKMIAHYDKIEKKDLKILKDISKRDKNFKILMNSSGAVDFIRIYPAKQNTVYINGQPVKTDKDGNYSAKVNGNSVLIEFKMAGKTVISKQVDNLSNGEKVDLTNITSYSKVIEDMDNNSLQITNPIDNVSKNTLHSATVTPMMSSDPGGGGASSYPGNYDGQPLYAGDHVHCVRMNGPSSDHHYWTWSHPTSWDDFLGSDCDWGIDWYPCPYPPASDTHCDGLNAQGNGVHDCSSVNGWSQTVWWR